MWFPRAPHGVYVVVGNSDYGPTVDRLLSINRATGEILEDRLVTQTEPLYWFGTWNYALHVGSVLGMTSKILWLITWVILMTSPLTGLWMWWERRPRGQLGLPRRVDARRPKQLITTVAGTSILLSTLGVSVLVVLLIELLRWGWRRARVSDQRYLR